MSKNCQIDVAMSVTFRPISSHALCNVYRHVENDILKAERERNEKSFAEPKRNHSRSIPVFLNIVVWS